MSSYSLLRKSNIAGNPISNKTKMTPGGGTNHYNLFTSKKHVEIIDMLCKWEDESELREEKDCLDFASYATWRYNLNDTVFSPLTFLHSVPAKFAGGSF